MTATAEKALQSAIAPRPFKLIDPEKQLEWVDGRAVIKEASGARHSRIGLRLAAQLGEYLKTNPIGEIYGADTSFTFGENERIPDMAFVSAARIPPEGDPVGVWPIAPDLAAEIVSPNDLFEALEARIRDYFASGVQQVWLVSPQFETVTIYDSPVKAAILHAGDELTSPALLPGFRCPVAALFQPVVRA